MLETFENERVRPLVNFFAIFSFPILYFHIFAAQKSVFQMKYSNNCGVSETKYNLLNINNLESDIYIYILLIINALQKAIGFSNVS